MIEGFQSQFVIVQLAWVALGLLVFATLLMGPLAWSILLDEPSADSMALATAFIGLHDHIWLPLGALFLMLACVFILQSHRVAGPLYRFRRVFARVASGDLSFNVRIRQKDYLVQEAADLDRMVSALRDRVSVAQQELEELRRAIAGLRHTPDALRPDRLSALEARAADVDAILAAFIVRPSDANSPDAPVQTSDSDTSNPVDPIDSCHPANPVAGDLRMRAASRRGDGGFSLLELLIVAWIIMCLSALGAPVYTNALTSARVTRAIGDINAVGKDIMMFEISQHCLPDTLADIGRTQLKDPWNRPYEYAVPRRPGGGRGGGGGGGGSCQACNDTCVPPGAARKDKNLVPINNDFDLYSKGKDGKSQSPLTNPASDDDIIRARDGGFIGLGKDF